MKIVLFKKKKKKEKLKKKNSIIQKALVKTIINPKWDCEKQTHKYKLIYFYAQYNDDNGRPTSPVFMLECEECGKRITSKGNYWNYLADLWTDKKISSELHTEFHKKNRKHLEKIQYNWDVKNGKITKPKSTTDTDIISYYGKYLKLLDQYDRNELKPIGENKSDFILEYNECLKIISVLKEELSCNDLFGQERDGGLSRILSGIYQTFDGKELYPTITSKASSLFYFITKDHPFSDGNKRIASFLFVHFLHKCNFLVGDNDVLKINGNCLVSLALLIAGSNSDDKEVIINLIQNFLINYK